MIAPLQDAGVLITRPAHQAEGLARAVEEAGGRALRFPVLAIEALDDRSEAIAALQRLRTGDWVVFVSPNAVELGLGVVREHAPAGARFAAVGPGTAAALAAGGFEVAAAPAEGDGSEALLGHPSLRDMHDRRVVICRGEGGRGLIEQTLAGRGAEVAHAVLYRRILPRTDTLELRQWLAQGRVHVIVVSSATGLRHLLQAVEPELAEALRALPVVGPSGRVIKQARESGFTAELIEAAHAGDAAVLEAIEAFWRRRNLQSPELQ
jgi:uroporphyrinogen-III synthase